LAWNEGDTGLWELKGVDKFGSMGRLRLADWLDIE
jgi:hypothetical protein